MNDNPAQKIQAFFKQTNAKIPLHEPIFCGAEWQYVKDCLDTGWVSSVGSYVDRFEQDLADYTGTKHAVVVANGTAALHISFLLAGVEPDDEVLIPSLTFIATANAVKYCNAIPHFVDSNKNNLGVDSDKLREYLTNNTTQKNKKCINNTTGRIIRALCVMHTLGHPVDLDPLVQICNEFNIVLVEDAAEALGSYYKGTHVGNFGLINALSFNGNKIITTGGGGAILTNDDKLAEQAKHITTTAKVPHPWQYQHDMVGFNYRMPNLNAAVGCAQLEKLDEFLQAKRNLAKRYQDYFQTLDGFDFILEPKYAKSNYWLNAVLIPKTNELESIIEDLNQAGIAVRPIWRLLHTLEMYAQCPKMNLEQAEFLQSKIICLPSSVSLQK